LALFTLAVAVAVDIQPQEKEALVALEGAEQAALQIMAQMALLILEVVVVELVVHLQVKREAQVVQAL
jgi:hypothetical protein